MSARQRFDAIRARLEAATPGPWEVVENFSSTSVRAQEAGARLGFRLVTQVPFRYAVEHRFVGVAGVPDDDECTHRADGTDATYCGLTSVEHDSRNRGDADLIAHAPTDLAALHAALESVLAQIDAFEDRYCGDDFSALSLTYDLRAAVEAALDPKDEV